MNTPLRCCALLALLTLTMSVVAVAQTCNTADRSVLLILDASGSMHARLPGGETRIAVARRALKDVATLFPDEARISLRLYGSQSPRDNRDCLDTNVAVPFGPASANVDRIVASVDAAPAQGYTPIAHVLARAAGEEVGRLDRVTTEIELPAGVYEVSFGPASWKGIEVRSGETVTIEPGELRVTPNASAHVVDSETGVEFGQFDAVTSTLTLMPGVYDLRFREIDWRFIKVDGGVTTTLRPVRITLARDLRWERARVTTPDGTVVARFDAVTHEAVLPPGDYVVEVDGNRIPFPAAEGAVLELKPQ